jgi:hypothetical protein
MDSAKRINSHAGSSPDRDKLAQANPLNCSMPFGDRSSTRETVLCIRSLLSSFTQRRF